MGKEVGFNRWIEVAELCPAFPRDSESPGDEEGRGWRLGKAVLLGVCQSCPGWEGLGRVIGPGTAAEALLVRL